MWADNNPSDEFVIHHTLHFPTGALKNSIRPKLFLAPHEPQKTTALFQGFSQKNIDSIDFKVLPLLKKKEKIEVNSKKIRRGEKRKRGGKWVERGFFKWKWKGTGGWKWAKVVLGNVPPFFYFPDLFLSNLLGGHQEGSSKKSIIGAGNGEELMSKWTLISFFLAKTESHGYQITVGGLVTIDANIWDCLEDIWKGNKSISKHEIELQPLE